MTVPGSRAESQSERVAMSPAAATPLPAANLRATVPVTVARCAADEGRRPARARRRRRLLGVALGLAVLVGTAGCTGPVRSDRVYAAKAAATAEAARSAVQTAQLAVQEAAAGELFDRTLAQALAEAARDAGDAQATFDAIQPPDGRADALRRQLDGLLVPAVSVLADLRIAARRGDVAELPKLAAPLPELAAELERFQEAHQ